jgi:5-methylcytosine-specific restriction endonuclease McrA
VTGGRDTHVDHVVRKRDGGTDSANNLITTCADCNLTRG